MSSALLKALKNAVMPIFHTRVVSDGMPISHTHRNIITLSKINQSVLHFNLQIHIWYRSCICIHVYKSMIATCPTTNTKFIPLIQPAYRLQTIAEQ